MTKRYGSSFRRSLPLRRHQDKGVASGQLTPLGLQQGATPQGQKSQGRTFNGWWWEIASNVVPHLGPM